LRIADCRLRIEKQTDHFNPKIRNPQSAVRNFTEVTLLTQVVIQAAGIVAGVGNSVARKFASTSEFAQKKCG
jgi:hypothetical protein